MLLSFVIYDELAMENHYVIDVPGHGAAAPRFLQDLERFQGEAVTGEGASMVVPRAITDLVSA